MKALLTTALVLVAALGIALAQRPKAASDPGPVDDRMARMITMMGEMREQMKEMQGQMKGMQGMGLMQGGMDRMMGMMGRLDTEMLQHRSEMQKLCPGNAAPQPPKKGG